MLDSKGMFPKDGEDRPELPDYLRRTLKAVTLGYFSDEAPTILSIAINIILGFSAVGLLADVRDIIGCIVNFDNTPESWFELIISLMAIIPLLDSLKYVDEVVDVANPVVKNSDEAADIVKNILKNEYGAIGKVVVENGDEAADIAKGILKNSDEAVNTGKAVVKGSDEAGNIGKAVIKNGDEAADVGKAVVKESLESSLKNIDDFIDGNKSFEDVLDDYAKIYADKVNSNVIWSWDKSIKGAEKLKGKHKLIKQYAVDHAYIPNIKVTKVPGMKYGFADFRSAGVVKKTVYLPENMWKMTDSEQFKWLDKKIGGHIDGYTWHHTEIPGKMELVPYGIHHVTNHNGGRTRGMWSDAPRK